MNKISEKFNFNIKNHPIDKTSPQWELATRLLQDSDKPEKILESFFQRSVLTIEKVDQIKFKAAVIENVRKKIITTDKIEVLNNTFIRAFCDKILSGIKTNEIEKMLNEHKENNLIKHSIYSTLLLIYNDFNQADVVQAVKTKAYNKSWFGEIQKTFQDELEMYEINKFFNGKSNIHDELHSPEISDDDPEDTEVTE